MSSAVKLRNLFAAAAVVVAVTPWSAEAGPKYPGYKAVSASQDISTRIAKDSEFTLNCYVYNNGDQNVCAVYDVFPVWRFTEASPGRVTQYIPAKNGRSVAWAFSSQQSTMQCKLVSARYVPWNGQCP